MAQPESNHTVTVKIDGAALKRLADVRRELKRISAEAREATRDVARLIELANKAGAMGIGFELEEEA